jgi:hypothetical protein
MLIKPAKTIALSSLTAFFAVVMSSTVALAELLQVAANELEVRRGPGTGFPATYVLRQGDRVEVIRRQGEWAFIVGERGGEGWVDARYLSAESSSPSPTPSPAPPNLNQVFRGEGTVDNARYNDAGRAQLVINPNNEASLSLGSFGEFDIEYIGTVRSNFEGTVQLQVTQFRSSEMGYRTVSASGTCDIQTSGGDSIRRAYCTVTGTGIDHGRSNFTAQ